MRRDDAHVFGNVCIVIGNDHVLAAQHIGRPEQNRVSQAIGGCKRFFRGKHRFSGRARDFALLQQFVEPLAVFGGIDAVRAGAEDIDAQFRQMPCQLDGRLAAKLHHHAPRFFHRQNGFHILGGQRVEIEAVGGIKVGGNGFGVVVCNDRFASAFLERAHTVHGAIVELDPLPDADGAGAEHEDLLFIVLPFADIDLRFVFFVPCRVEIWRFCIVFRRAGIHHLIYRRTVDRRLLL